MKSGKVKNGIELTLESCSRPAEAQRLENSRPRDLVGSKVVKLLDCKAEKEVKKMRLEWYPIKE